MKTEESFSLSVIDLQLYGVTLTESSRRCSWYQENY